MSLPSNSYFGHRSPKKGLASGLGTTQVKPEKPSHKKSKVKCPTCAHGMIQRARKSDGHKFWGCSQYPDCAGTREIGDVVAEKYSEGSPCPKCATPLEKRIPKDRPEKAKKKKFIYAYYFFCTSCKHLYMTPEAQRPNLMREGS